MAEGINVRIHGKLRDFVETQVGIHGLYESVSEYIRSLIRQDYENAEIDQWNTLHDQLSAGLSAPEEAFQSFLAEEIISSAQALKKSYVP